VPPTYPVVPVFEAMRSLGQLPPEAMEGGRGGDQTFRYAGASGEVVLKHGRVEVSPPA